MSDQDDLDDTWSRPSQDDIAGFTGVDVALLQGPGKDMNGDFELRSLPGKDSDGASIGVSAVLTTRDRTHRRLKPRHIQLIGIGGTIGTTLYVQIGRGLMSGGPGSLFLAFTFWYVTPEPLNFLPRIPASVDARTAGRWSLFSRFSVF